MLQAGLDWATSVHALCVVDSEGKKVLETEVDHTAAGLAQMRRQLARLGPPEQIPIAIERPSGLVVDTLVEAGHPVVPIHPNILKAARPRYNAAGCKSDRSDAYMLGDLLRTDGHRFRVLQLPSDSIRALRALVRAREDLLKQQLALANQLRDQLQTFWPGAARLFFRIDSPISLAFLKKYPCPSKARRLGPKRMERFLKEQGYSGGRRPQELVATLRSAPVAHAGPLEVQARRDVIQGLVRILTTVLSHVKKLTSQIEAAVVQIPQGRVLQSFPRAGRLNAAQILAELGTDPARFPTEAQLAAEAGVAPVTRSSGKHKAVVFRHACNKRLRKALTTFAGNSRHDSPWAAKIYAKARARRCRHTHAVRILARAWVRVLWRAWTDEVAYDPQKHRAAVAITPG